MKVPQARHDFAWSRVSLHLRRINHNIRRMMPPRQNIQDVAQRGPLRRGDDPNALRQRRNLFFAGGVE